MAKPLNFDNETADDYTGCPSDEDIGEQIVQEAAKQALRKYNAESDEPYYRFIVEIQGSKVGFLIGFMHNIKIVLGQSTVRKEKMSAEDFEQITTTHFETSTENRKTIIALCVDCKEGINGEASPNPCRGITISENVWADFDAYDHD